MIEFLKRQYKSPLWAASGTYGWGVEAVDGAFVPKRGLAALVTKGVSPKEMLGAPQSRIAEVGEGVGLLNAIGLQNPGVEKFLEKYASRYNRGDFPLPIWVNVFADSIAGYVFVVDEIRRFTENNKAQWLAGFELNVSCPNVDKGGAEFGAQPDILEKLVSSCVQAAGAIPTMVKLSPHASDIVAIAKACESAGAAALAISNTMPAGFPIPENNTWSLGRKFGGLSGPALRPISLRLVDLVANKVKLPICGIGGIQSAHDVREYLSAGAVVVQVGTAHFANPWICDEIFDGLAIS